MILKAFFRNILLRVIFITLTSIGMAYLITQLHNEFYFSFIGLSVLLLLQVYFLVLYINKINKHIGYLLDSISDENFMFSYGNKRKGLQLNEFRQSVENLKIILQKSKFRHLKKEVYLNNIVNHINIGLLLLDEHEYIELINPAAKSILKMEKLNSVNDLEKVMSGLSDIIRKSEPSKPTDLKINIENEILHLLFKASIIKIDGKMLKLISFENIKDELERNELSSWQKLIKIFTHEVMNAITPIVSLSASLQKQLKNEISEHKMSEKMHKNTAEKTLGVLKTVEDTSKGLLNFVGKYRDLTTLPQAQIENVRILTFFNQIAVLLCEEMESSKIKLNISVEPENLQFHLDKNLIELTLINLMKNADYALRNIKHKEITLKAYIDHIDRNVIEVKDNGPGIKADIIHHIFTPFYSTKKGGTGIGLSLCRQIMNIHNGKINVVSSADSGTCFRLIF